MAGLDYARGSRLHPVSGRQLKSPASPAGKLEQSVIHLGPLADEALETSLPPKRVITLLFGSLQRARTLAGAPGRGAGSRL
jgi:hypothetical protein